MNWIHSAASLCTLYWVNYSISLTWIKATDLPFGRTPPRKQESLNLAATWGWFPLLTMIPGLGRSEVVIIYPDFWVVLSKLPIKSSGFGASAQPGRASCTVLGQEFWASPASQADQLNRHPTWSNLAGEYGCIERYQEYNKQKRHIQIWEMLV